MDKKHSNFSEEYFMTHPCVQNFINKIKQLISVQYLDKKQKYMQTQQQPFQNQELFNMSVQLFRENLGIDEEQLRSQYVDEKFIAYINCIERIGITVSSFYLERQGDFKLQISVLKKENNEYKQNLTNYMQQNQGLKQLIDQYQNDRQKYDEMLNSSQHQLQRGKHEIQNQISANQALLKENEKMKRQIQELYASNINLMEMIQQYKKNLTEKVEQIKKQNAQTFGLKKQLEKELQKYSLIQQQKIIAQKQIQSLLQLIEQKDIHLGERGYKQGQDLLNSAQHSHPFYLNSIKVVREENQQYGSDKQIMKGLQHNFENQPILPLRFGQSRSISETSKKSQTSLTIEKVQIDFNNQNQSPETQRYEQTKDKRMKTQTKVDLLSVKKNGGVKSYSKNIKRPQLITSVKKKYNQVSTPIPRQKIDQKQKSLTAKNKQQIQKYQKQKKTQLQKSSVVKSKRLRSNTSGLLFPRTKSKQKEQIGLKRGKIEHSQSVQDLYFNDPQIISQKQQIEVQLINKQKWIEHLRLQNRSVRQLALQQSQKLTQAEYEYEQLIQKLQSELDFYKKEFRKSYSNFIQQKSLCQAYQNQLQKVSDQIENQKFVYEKTATELKQKCKFYMDEQIAIYRQKYEEVCIKLKHMQSVFGHSSIQDGEILLDEQNNQKQLKKCKSNSLFYKQIKHHSYSASQQCSEINTLSANHSKNASVLIMQDDDIIRQRQEINIVENYNLGEEYLYDYDQHDLNSYREDKQLKQQQVQTDFDENHSSKISQSQVSRLPDSFEISQMSSLEVKSSFQDSSKIKMLLQKQLKINKLKSTRVIQLNIQPLIIYQKQAISEFDTLELSSKIHDTLTYASSFFDQYQWAKKNQQFKLFRNIDIQVFSSVNKLDFQSQTQEKVLSIIKPEPLELRFLENSTNSFSETLKKQMLVQLVYNQIIFQSKQFESSQKQIKNIFCNEIGIETVQNLYLDEYIQTNLISKKNIETQYAFYNNQSYATQSQTITNNLSIQNAFNYIILPELKPKIDQNQSFNQEYLNQVLNDMTQSFDISQKFIQTLKKKLLSVHDHLKQIQDKNNQSCSSDGSSIQKTFKNIHVDEQLPQKNKYSSQITDKLFKLQNFQGNVKTSKASTNCSVSVLDSFSPLYQNDNGIVLQLKQKITPFEQIQQIQSENIESFQIGIQSKSKINLSAEQYSVNKSFNNQSQMNQSSVKPFQLCLQEIQLSKQIEQIGQNKQQRNVLGSPKHHKICKLNKNQKFGTITSSKNGVSYNNIKIHSPRNKILWNEIRNKKSSLRIQKSGQLNDLSQDEYQYLGRRFRPKKFQLVQKINFQQSNNKSKGLNLFEKGMTKLSENDLLIVVCKKNIEGNAQKKCSNIEQDIQTTQQIDIIAITSSKITSLKERYIFTSQRHIQMNDESKLILGNHQIVISQNRLKYGLQNKINYFSLYFPQNINFQEIQQIKQQSFQIEKIIKFRIR